ncbi:aldehyde dehydrogenase family protein [Microbacterium sp. NFH-22A-Y]|uniref:aldehyde dehydrogenase family protein n=1 Tax=Microbacterium sp. NFH-22A-Y TaxID=2744448 RepID=UPI001F370185|nr:aldehyde dehydrogenase family protein [Microbacterium sp. NFH-22A-Y]
MPIDNDQSVERTPMWIGGRPVHGDRELVVQDPFTGGVAGVTTLATDEQVERAIRHADAARKTMADLPLHARASALRAISAGLVAAREEIVDLMVGESGKPRSLAVVEVERAASVFAWAAENARQWSGAVTRLDGDPSGEGRLAFVRRYPRGSVLGISPFNFPLNLAAHKVAPAIAVGAPIVLKPAPKTPLSGLVLGRLAAETGLPAGAVSVINVDDLIATKLVSDPRLPVISFTGSARVGYGILRAVPEKHVTLELGGNAAVIIAQDIAEDEDGLASAMARIALFGNAQAGQSCVSVQRVLVPSALYERARDALVSAVRDLRQGDPRDPTTQVGPVINADAADRIASWVEEAREGGARVVVGAQRSGLTLTPTVLEDVPADARIATDEVFGPVMILERFDDIDEAFAMVNRSRFGLQAGVFTRDIAIAFRAHRDLDVGGVIVGDVPTYRSDQMPYGGVKESGVGREGVKSAMTDLTEERVLVLSGLDL